MEIIALANSSGTLYIDISDHGDIIGVSNPDETIHQVANMAWASIKPDITMSLQYNTILMDGKLIVAIENQQGTNKPYYLAKKDLRPEGVYVRQGTSSAPASDAAIRRMIKETDGDSFEAMRSLEQELTFVDQIVVITPFLKLHRFFKKVKPHKERGLTQLIQLCQATFSSLL